MPVCIMLYTYTGCLSDISDRMDIYGIAMPDVSCCNLYRRLFHLYI